MSGESVAKTRARKIILHVPLSDEALLSGFVEDCLRDKVALVAVVGAGCRRIEDPIDEMVIGYGSDQTRFLCTSSHPDDSIEDIRHLVRGRDAASTDPVEEIRP